MADDTLRQSFRTAINGGADHSSIVSSHRYRRRVFCNLNRPNASPGSPNYVQQRGHCTAEQSTKRDRRIEAVFIAVQALGAILCYRLFKYFSKAGNVTSFSKYRQRNKGRCIRVVMHGVGRNADIRIGIVCQN